jgi:hypothetical protein
MDSKERLFAAMYGAGDIELAEENVRTSRNVKLKYLVSHGWRVALHRSDKPLEKAGTDVLFEYIVHDPWLHSPYPLTNIDAAWLVEKARQRDYKTRREVVRDCAISQLRVDAGDRLLPLISHLVGGKLPRDLISEKGEVVLPGGRKITQSLVRRMVKDLAAAAGLAQTDQSRDQVHVLQQTLAAAEAKVLEQLRPSTPWKVSGLLVETTRVWQIKSFATKTHKANSRRARQIGAGALRR